MSSAEPAAGPFGRLSWLLVATALALLPPLAGRLATLWHHGTAADPASTTMAVARGTRALPALIEPAAGPEPVSVPPPPPRVPAVPPAANPEPQLTTALDELAAELGRRQTLVAEREQALALREAVMKSLESRIRAARSAGWKPSTATWNTGWGRSARTSRRELRSW